MTVETDQGSFSLHDWIGDKLGDSVQPPQGFHPGLHHRIRRGRPARRRWEKRDTKVIGLSVDGVEDHVKWKEDIEGYAGAKAGFPIIADEGLAVSKAFDMLPADAYLPDGRTASDSQSVRSVFIISPDKKLQLIMTYPMSVGRNFAEVLRALDALQSTYDEPIATPANWTKGQDVIVALAVSDEDAQMRFGEIDIKLPYLRTTRDPS